MRSPSSCRRCRCPLEVEPTSGLCETCQLLADTSHDVPKTPPPIPFPVPLVPDSPLSPIGTGFPPTPVFGPTVTHAQLLGPSDVTSASVVTAIREHPLPSAPPGYDLYAHLGGGGMGDVYLAKEHFTERFVAMKFVRAAANRTAMERFLIEVRSLAAIKHPNILQVLSTDFLRADPFFTTELANGGSLGKWVEARGPFDPIDAARIMSVAARAIEVAHRAGILHRDLKPSNILLASDHTETRVPRPASKSADTPNPIAAADAKTPISAGSDLGIVAGGGVKVSDFPPEVKATDFRPVVGDFGLAKRMEHDDGATVGSGPVGTPSYMPPEQITSKNGPVGPASDVYGLGATIYHLLVGRPPYGPGPQEEVIQQVLLDAPPRPRALRKDVPAKLDGIVVKCMEKDPKDRYPSAEALADDLDAFLAGGATVAPELTPLRRFRRWVSRHSKALAGSVLLVLLAAGLVGAGVAMAPKPVEPKELLKVDPWLAIERELDASDGKTPIVLVGEKGMPRYSAWKVNEPKLGLSATQDGTLELHSHGLVHLELARDPRHESFQLVAQIRQDDGVDDQSFVGVYLGYEQINLRAGDILEPAVGTWHSEFQTSEEGKNEARTAERQLALKHVTRRCMPDTTPLIWSDGGGPRIQGKDGKGPRLTSLYFQPFGAGHPVMPWRTIVLEVSPELITFRWSSDVDAKGKLIRDKKGNPVQQPLSESMKALVLADELTAPEINRERQILRLHVRDDGPRGAPFLAITDWNPRRPLGIWFNNSTVSVRNVTILPRPKPKPNDA